MAGNPCSLRAVLSGRSTIAGRAKRSGSSHTIVVRTMLSGRNRPENSPAGPSPTQTQQLGPQQLPTAPAREPSALYLAVIGQITCPWPPLPQT